MSRQTFTLTKDARRYLFVVEGSTVRIKLFDGSWCRSERTRTKPEAREEYGLLLRRGWKPW